MSKHRHPLLILTHSNLGLCCSKCNNGKKDYNDPNNQLINPFVDEPPEFFLAYGDLIFAVTRLGRAWLTEIKLKLNRAELAERRKERCERLRPLLDQYLKAPTGPIKELIYDEFCEEASPDKEFTFTVRNILKLYNVACDT